jgi:HTH-type transcriptional regulator, sugar sensing transcriptional regulator
MVSTNRLVQRLGELGMSAYEAKAYLALVTAGRPLNGYEVAKNSGVPRSTVYEALGKLVHRGAAFEARTAQETTCYLPLPPNALLNRMSQDFEESLQALKAELPSLSAPQEAHLIHNIASYEPLLQRCEDVIRDARRELFVSIWPEELDRLRPILEQAQERGVDVTMLVFGEDPAPIGHTYRHRFSPPDFVLKYLGYRLFVVVSDDRQSVVGGSRNNDAWGVYSDNPAVVTLSMEYVRHDIAMQLLGSEFGATQVTDYVRSNPDFVHLRAARSAIAPDLAPPTTTPRRSTRKRNAS